MGNNRKITNVIDFQSLFLHKNGFKFQMYAIMYTFDLKQE